MADPEEFDAIAAAKELDDMLGRSGAADGNYVAALESELAALHTELARANQRADQAHAEIDAASRRISGAAAKELEQRARKLLEGFLPVLDDLDRGIRAARTHAESADVVDGLELIRRSMLARFGAFGVVHAPALGARFDPERHEAIALVPVASPEQDGRVIDVMREGYLIGDATLRPAGVAVGKKAR